tara:strand:+ start:185 stop:787 length:603 start_codon:yes stop_codon:yes gene_type:complete
MFNPDTWFSPWSLAPIAVMMLLCGLFLKGACSAFNRAVDDNPSASIEPPSFMRALAILVIMFAFITVANWGMASGMSYLEPADMGSLMSHVPKNHEGSPLLTPESVYEMLVVTLWMTSALLQYVFCSLLMMYGFNVRYRQANVIAFLFAQRAAIYSTMLVALLGTGISIYLQRSESERQSSQETEAVSTETSGVHESLAD